MKRRRSSVTELRADLRAHLATAAQALGFTLVPVSMLERCVAHLEGCRRGPRDPMPLTASASTLPASIAGSQAAYRRWVARNGKPPD